jgi:hypothetical protein
MTKISTAKCLGLGLVLFCGQAFSQSSGDQFLGDAAREQQAAHAQQKKAAIVHTEINDTPLTLEASDASTAKPTNTADAKAPKSATKTSAPDGQRSVLDRPLGEKPDPYVVPAGTEIRVDLTESKITVPVRLGFATPIPALTKVAVQTDRAYFPTYGAYSTNDPGYAEFSTLTAVTVDGKTYTVQTNRVQVGGTNVNPAGTTVSSSRDAVFVLSATVEIER